MTEDKSKNFGSAITHPMPLGHIDKTTKILADAGITQSILGYSFVKINNVPEKLAYLLELSPDELDADETLAPLLDLAKAQAEIVNSAYKEGNVIPKIVVREGSLIIIVGIISILTNLFREEIREKIFELSEKVQVHFKDPENSPYNAKNLARQAHELYSMLMVQLNKSNDRHKRKAQNLKDATIEVLGLDNTRDVFAQGRLGPAQNLAKLLDNFTAARASNRPMELRLTAMTIAKNQAVNLYSSLTPIEDKEFLLNLLILRLSGSPKIIKEKLNNQEKLFNSEVDIVIEIVNKLKKDMEKDF